MKIKLSIADDHPVVLKGLQQILAEYEQLILMDTVSDGEQLLNVLQSHQPDVLLLDIQMPGKNGFELTQIISKKYPSIAILILTNIDLPYQARNILQNGASGFLLKSAHPQILLHAIETVYNGKQFIDPVIKELLLQEMTEPGTENLQLTLREKEILTLIAKEFTNAEIAEQLFISQRTVDNHRLNILFKLGVKNTAGLIKKAIQLGIV